MNNEKYELASSSWGDEELMAIEQVVASGQFSMGPNVEQYEQDFATYFGSEYAVMTSSGSTANLLMVAALFYSTNESLKLHRGDEVIVPAVGWSTSYFPLSQYGLKLIFVDIDINTLNFDVQKLRNAVTRKTKLILAINLLGNPNPFCEINEIARDNEITLIEDNCESMGALYKGKYCGTFGVMGTFSSFYSHHISTMEGGCVLTNDKELYHILLSMRAHGWTRNLPDVNEVSGSKSHDSFCESFKFVLPGYNVRPLEMSGAIGIHQLKKLQTLLKVRRSNAAVFKELFQGQNFFIQEEIGKSSWFGFSLIAKPSSGIERPKILEKLRENNIEYRPIVSGNFLKNPVIEHLDFEVRGGLENAEVLDANGFFVGNHHYDLTDKINRLHALVC